MFELMFELRVGTYAALGAKAEGTCSSSTCPNNLYIGAQPALVPCYPRIGDDVLNKYERTELELFL
jgi:hypothetical protein